MSTTTTNHHVSRLVQLREQVADTDSCMAGVLDLAIGWMTEAAPEPNGLSKQVAATMVGLVSYAWAAGEIDKPMPTWAQAEPHLGDPKALANRVPVAS